MKRTLFFLMMLTLFYEGHAQDEPGLKIGAKVGGNLTYLWGQGTTATTVKPIPGVHLGVYVRYALNEKITFQPELLFSTRGIHVQNYSDINRGFYVNQPQLPSAGFSVDGPNSYRTRIDIFYLDLPLMIQYQVIEKLKIHAGPVVSLNVWDSYPKTYTSEQVRVSGNKAYSKLNPWEISAAIGASYDLALMGQNLTVGGRYSLGLTRINEAIRANDDLKSSVFQIFVAYDITDL